MYHYKIKTLIHYAKSDFPLLFSLLKITGLMPYIEVAQNKTGNSYLLSLRCLCHLAV